MSKQGAQKARSSYHSSETRRECGREKSHASVSEKSAPATYSLPRFHQSLRISRVLDGHEIALSERR